MAVHKILIETFLEMSATYPVMDVRSPAEYSHAHFPGAQSLPVFSDEERKVVGTAYKQESREIAIKKGLALFGPKMNSIVEDAEKICAGKEKKVLMHCWRGGMRSAAMAWLLGFSGFEVYLLEGGYKIYRQWVREQFDRNYNIKILGGYTGSGKTDIIKYLQQKNITAIDLEKIAHHRGSAFGAYATAQPSQEMFENLLAGQLSAINEEILWLEDESQRIGNLIIPNEFWEKMRRSTVYFLELSFEERLHRTVMEYAGEERQKLMDNIDRIQKRLGPLQTKLSLQHLAAGEITECFTFLLQYYDKLYGKSLLNREKEIRVIRMEFSHFDAEQITAKLLKNINPEIIAE